MIVCLTYRFVYHLYRAFDLFVLLWLLGFARLLNLAIRWWRR
jgi:hypothetical protein